MTAHNLFRRTFPWPNLKVDWPVCSVLLIISVFGLFVLYSAKQNILLVERQAIRLSFAFGIMLVMAQFPPRFYARWALWVYAGVLVLLFLVFILGDTAKGGQRWIHLGVFKLQPSELMKLSLPLILAYFLQDTVFPPRWRTVSLCLVLIGLPAILIAVQPDLGTAILITCSGIFVLWFAGISWKMILSAFGIGVCCLPLGWYVLHDYQKERILTLLNPDRDPLGSGYQIIQSKIAIGSGGLFGKGWLQGTQSQLEFLPERSTDFIFAVLSEELGLLSVFVLFCLYLFLILRGFSIAIRAQDFFSRLVAGALSLTLFVYVFVNVGMVSGILPVVGIPLPLISHGGSSIVTLMMGFGILMSISTHRRLLA